MVKKLDYFKDMIMDGHIIGLSPEQLASYRLAGITTNHECISYEEAKEQVRMVSTYGFAKVVRLII